MSEPSRHPPSAFSTPRPPNVVVLEDFQILKRLGSGTMGAVYLARQISQDRDVALKMLAQSLVEKPDFVERFSREARILASLDHPNVVRILGVGGEHGCYYYAMEYVNGFTLATLRDGLGGRMTIEDSLYFTLKCAAGLHHAHERRIVHRDVKPENLMINHLGEVKITDLGLAKSTEKDPGLTDSGAGVGTPRYMAPEQARSGKNADRRADIYSLGCTLYELVTGRLPFDAETSMELMLAKDKGYFPPARRLNRQVPPRLELFLDKMLAKDPRVRYQNCADLIRDLESLEMAREYLSFNVLQVGKALRPDVPATDSERVEVLLIHNDPCAVRQVQDSLYESRIPSFLRVVSDADKAVACLRREGKYATVPRPNLILLGLPLDSRDGRAVLKAIRDDELLHAIPMVILAAPANSGAILAADGLKASLILSKPEDLSKVEDLLRSVHEMCQTVVESRKKPKG